MVGEEGGEQSLPRLVNGEEEEEKCKEIGLLVTLIAYRACSGLQISAGCRARGRSQMAQR